MTEKIINPAELSSFPIVVLCSDMRGVVSSLIKIRTGNFNHAMIMVRPGLVVTQNFVLKEIPISKYMESGRIMQFWAINGLTKDDLEKMVCQINKDLKSPWWARSYDFLGILGQATGLTWIQSPFGNYCSENVAKYLRILKKDVPKRPDPSDLGILFKNSPDDFENIGMWVEM